MSLFGYFYNLNVTRETVLRVVSGLDTGFSGVSRRVRVSLSFLSFLLSPRAYLILSLYLICLSRTYQIHLLTFLPTVSSIPAAHEVITTLSI